MSTSWDDHPEPDLDDLTREQLAEYEPSARAVADALDEWLHRMHGVTSSHHHAGAFLEFLALHGYTVTAMEPVTPLDKLLPPATDGPALWALNVACPRCAAPERVWCFDPTLTWPAFIHVHEERRERASR